MGGGYFYGGPRHSDGLIQIEYKPGKYCFGYFRPQATLVIPELKGAFLGIGLGLECYLSDHIVFTPSFEPGYYYRGRSRDLGCPIEFRSAVELACEKKNGQRMGLQFYHISNAHLGHHNPGANALIVFFALPL